MTSKMKVTFLGTTSGGGPTETRNCSSLVLDALGNGCLWMFDCAEGTIRQFAQQPGNNYDYNRLRVSRLTKIFITHMHADHTMGLITVLRNVLGIPRNFSHSHDANAPSPARIHKAPAVEVYGPAGIRAFVRTIFNLTHTRSDRHYCVHELLMSSETSSASCDAEALHNNEEAGRDIVADEQGFWKDLFEERMSSGGSRATVDAGPIVHRGMSLAVVLLCSTLSCLYIRSLHWLRD
ncbi:hypothetical protein NM688_g416 [Phlebia brevispora]|uniref:Uncharacterized protein n=1 Tax=Phlebia brevispora TaxID=194682 RepID=A0ACC1TE82_9APHY|nr:hypothetical protein NM688_g416 [Phlebia brevispora]